MPAENVGESMDGILGIICIDICESVGKQRGAIGGAEPGKISPAVAESRPEPDAACDWAFRSAKISKGMNEIGGEVCVATVSQTFRWRSSDI